ncbi:GAF and ANTAR domain-containing protein [Aquihabitans sp. G128]|uniref:GAF and ANTAR domain-containing protein n=1 Tax=Aquihabitans sp. G128 TaxID=2849779 RepID=UPI001C24BBB6|nr:GAF and ANTAR domain-containing protein [Aquihabitans sp. G128]QXC62431.1 GAF and ANTAR domain-containing protein [Aquihabitans sp. G128]
MPDPEPGQVDLAEQFAAVSRALLAEHDVPATLARIIVMATETIPHCQHAGIDLVEGGVITPVAQSDEVPARFGALQTETGEGPCLDAIRDQEMFLVGHLSEESRWPELAAQAHAETGVQSILAFRLFAGGRTLAALNLYSAELDAFGDHDIAIGSIFAAHAAVALQSARAQQTLEEGLRSRDLIGQAKGILMSRDSIDEDAAFDLLRRASQRLNIKLRDVATQIIESQPPPPAGPRA